MESWMFGASVYAAVGFGATVEWLLVRNAVSKQAPIRWSGVLLTFLAWPLSLFSVVAMLCSPRVKSNVRKNYGAKP